MLTQPSQESSMLTAECCEAASFARSRILLVTRAQVSEDKARLPIRVATSSIENMMRVLEEGWY